MLETLFGNRTAEKVLTFIAVNKDAYAQEIADRTSTALSLVQAQLQRLERGSVLVSRPRGRMRFYTFNPRSPFSKPIEAFLRRSIDYLPDKERAMYIVRGRPRMKGRPLTNKAAGSL